MYSVTEDSGLVACYAATADERQVDRALKRLDRGLFLDKELDHARRVVYVVKHHVGSGMPPVPVLAWADDDGTPRPLVWSLVDRVRAQEVTRREQIVNGKTLAASAQRVRDREAASMRQEREDLIREHEPRLKAGHGKPVTISTPLRTAG